METLVLPNYFSEIKNVSDNFMKSGFTQNSTFPVLTQRITEMVIPNLVLSNILTPFGIGVGSTASFPKMPNARANGICGKTDNGESIDVDFTPYSTITVTPYKIGVTARFGREMIEDEIVSIVEDQIRNASRRMISAIECDVEMCMATATKKRFDFLPYRYPSIKNIVWDSRIHKTLVAHDSSVAPKLSPTTPFDNILLSPNMPSKRAYLIEQEPRGCYAPVGYMVVKKRGMLFVDLYPRPEYDSIDLIITARYAPVITYPEAIRRYRV